MGEDPYNLDALLALGVSYVNEMYYDKALAALKVWTVTASTTSPHLRDGALLTSCAVLCESACSHGWSTTPSFMA